jgi:hypothetical protein
MILSIDLTFSILAAALNAIVAFHCIKDAAKDDVQDVMFGIVCGALFAFGCFALLSRAWADAILLMGVLP